jgi:hypothetical protein
MTVINPNLADAIAAKGVPLSADWAPSKPLPGYLAAIGQAGSEYEQALYAAYVQAMAEVGWLQAELAARMEDIAFTDRSTLPELRRTIQHHEDGKKRWRDRAEKAEARVRELERPAVDAHRNEVRQSYMELANQAREDRDYEGAFDVDCRLREREAQWKREDEEAAS